MKKSYFVDGAMALALACTLVGCSKDDLSSGEVSTNSSIDAASDQNWQMLNTGKVNIGINKDAGESYSVKLYANDPFVNNEGTVLAEGTVTSGNTFTSTFTYPTADTTFYAAYKDSKGYTYVKAVRVDNNAITTSFGTESSANAKSNIFTVKEFRPIAFAINQWWNDKLEHSNLKGKYPKIEFPTDIWLK